MYRAHWQFYKSIFQFITAFSLACIVFGGLLWALLLFITLGPFIGMLGFRIMYKDQFNFYHNLGLTRSRLMGVSFLINLLFGIPIFGILLLIIKFFIGNLTIT